MNLALKIIAMAFCAFSFAMACYYLWQTIKALIDLVKAYRELRRLTRKK